MSRVSWLVTLVGGRLCGTVVEMSGRADRPLMHLRVPVPPAHDGFQIDPPACFVPSETQIDVYRLERIGEGRTAVFVHNGRETRGRPHDGKVKP